MGVTRVERCFFKKSHLTLAFIKNRIFAPLFFKPIKKQAETIICHSSILQKLLHWGKFTKNIFFLKCCYPYISPIYDVQINDFFNEDLRKYLYV